MGKIIKNIITFVIIAILLFLAYLLLVEKKSLGELLSIGKDTLEDKALELKVESQISFNKMFKDADVSVEANDGEVTLSGTVSSSEKAVLAAQIANNVEGVERVINKIKVSSGLDDVSSADGRSERERMLDKELAEKAQAVLDTEDDLKGSKIKAIAFKTVLFLEGKVLSKRQKDLAVKLVRRIDKVRDVKENLTINYE